MFNVISVLFYIMSIFRNPNKLIYIIFHSYFQVRELVSECQCPTQFPMIRVSEGKYRIGDTQVLIFVRVSTFSINSCCFCLKKDVF